MLFFIFGLKAEYVIFKINLFPLKSLYKCQSYHQISEDISWKNGTQICPNFGYF